ncbi:MAG: hypothetical protein IT166_23180 [Bryobacterales bacterium]|nr:hypothetical protein [Bryobacterales bacterium]
MPRKPDWIHHIDSALAELDTLESPFIDRLTLQSLLHVSPRQALRILNRLAPSSAGTSLLIPRPDLIAKLLAIRNGENSQFEIRRRERLSHQLNRLRRDLKARQVHIEANPPVELLASLPPAIRLSPGRLEIQFTTAAELLTLLLSLGQAMTNDFDRFSEAVETSSG